MSIHNENADLDPLLAPGTIQPLDIINFGQAGTVPGPQDFDLNGADSNEPMYDEAGNLMPVQNQQQQQSMDRSTQIPTYDTRGKSVDQILTELNLGSVQPPPAPHQRPDGAPKPGDANYDPRNDPQRIEYHQSRADQYRITMERFAKAYGPVIEAVRQNPQLQKQLLGDPGTAVQALPPIVEDVKPPVRPTKPAGYNDADLAIPDSESAKFKTALDTYRDQFEDYILKRDEQVAIKEQHRQAAIQQAEAEQLQNRQTRETLKTKYKMNDQQADRFLTFMTDPKNFDLQNLVAFNNFMEATKARGGAKPMPSRQTAAPSSFAPMPPFAGGGAGPQVGFGDQTSAIQANDFMSAGLLASAKNRNRVQ